MNLMWEFMLLRFGSPIVLLSLSSEYVVVVFGYDDAYLVRLSDGASLIFSEGVPEDRTYQIIYYDESVSQSDNSYIYFERRKTC